MGFSSSKLVSAGVFFFLPRGAFFNPRPDPKTGATLVVTIVSLGEDVSIRAPIRRPGRPATWSTGSTLITLFQSAPRSEDRGDAADWAVPAAVVVSIRAPIRRPGRL